jgi:hypothetical protein
MKDLIFENALVKVTFRADGIIHIHYLTEELNLEKSKEVLAFTRKHSPWQLAPLFMSGGDFMSDSKESKAFNSSSEVLQYCSAIAFLSDSLAKKLLANFFIAMNKGKIPIRFFNTADEALKWLSNFPTLPISEQKSPASSNQSL